MGRLSFSVGFVAIAALLSSISTALAQPSDIIRWGGETALTPAQGYGMGNPLTLTWGFAATGTSIPSFGAGPTGANNLIARMDAIYGAGPGGSNLTQRPWFSLYQSTFNRWSSISGLSYVYEAADDGVAFSGTNGTANRGVSGVRADVRIAGRNIDGNSNVLAFNFYPNVGDMVIDTNDNFFENTASNSIRLRNVVTHEHGHGIGMPHVETPSSTPQLMNPIYNGNFDGPQHHDILMAHRGYGDFNEKSFGALGNDIATRATHLGTLAQNASLSLGNSARTFAVAATATDFVSIDHASDTDFYSLNVNSAGRIDVVLDSLGFTYTANNQSFNTKNRSDLALGLFDTNGSTLLAFANLTGLGGSESLAFNLLAAGKYYLRVTGVNNPDAVAIKTQFYGLTANFTAVPEPNSLTLVAMIGSALLLRRRRSA
jgi:hypothetical protein